MQKLKILQQYLKHFYSYIKFSGLFNIISVNSLQGITQGIGILLIIPLLGLLNSTGGESNKIVQLIESVFTAISIPLNLYSIVTIYIVLVSLTELLRQYQSIMTTSYMHKYTSFMRVSLFDTIIHAKWKYIQTKKRSSFTHSLTQDISQIGVATFSLLTMISSIFIIIFNAAIAFYINLPFTLTTIVFAAILTLLSRTLLSKAHKEGKLTRKYHQELYNDIGEVLGGLKNIKSHNLEHEQVNNFSATSNSMVEHVVSFVKNQAYTKSLHGIISTVALGIYFLVAIKIFTISSTSLLVLLFIFSRLVPIFSGLITSWQRTLNALPAFEGVEKLFKEAKKQSEKKGDQTKFQLEKSIELNKIDYKYKKDNNFELKDISFSIAAGSMAAFAGSSGSGKTTIADLITGILTPNNGNISIDKAVLQHENLFSWRKSISYVTQEAFFLNDSIRNNLLFGISKNIEDEKLWDVLKSCAIDKLILKLSDGLDTIIGDRGTHLSGGERQRLSIAMALLRKPSLLILDEATSALDYKNENFIYELINKLKGQMTIIVIAHRLSTIKSADNIIVMDKGSIVEEGVWNNLSKLENGYLNNLIKHGELK